MPNEEQNKTQRALDNFTKKLSKVKSLRTGSIAFHLTGEGGGEYCIDCIPGTARILDKLPLKAHAVEVIGNARVISSILEGTKDARKQFFAGNFRIKGDLRYLSDLAVELEIIKEPL